MISKRTIGLSLGGIVAAISGLWAVTTTVITYAAQVESNTAQIQEVVTSLKLGRVDDMVSDLQAERRGIKRELRDDPENDLLMDQIDTIENEIERMKSIRECVTDPSKGTCE